MHLVFISRAAPNSTLFIIMENPPPCNGQLKNYRQGRNKKNSGPMLFFARNGPIKVIQNIF